MPEQITEEEILESGSRDAHDEELLAIAEVEQEISDIVSQSSLYSHTDIEAKTREAFSEMKLTKKQILKRIEDRSEIYDKIGLPTQVGAASYTVRREIAHELGLVEVTDQRAFEVLTLGTYKGKVNQIFDKFRHDFFYNDIEQQQEDNWTGYSVLYYSGSRLFKKATALMTILGNLCTEIPVEVAKNIGIVKPWNLFNSYCVMTSKAAAGKGGTNSFDSGKSAIVMGVIEKVQKTGEGAFRAVEPTYFVLGVW